MRATTARTRLCCLVTIYSSNKTPKSYSIDSAPFYGDDGHYVAPASEDLDGLETHVLSQHKAIVYHILRSVGDPHELGRLAGVCRLWRDVASTPAIWNALLEQQHAWACIPTSTSCGKPAASASTSAASGNALVGLPSPVPPDNSAKAASSAETQRRAAQQDSLPFDLLQPQSDMLGCQATQLGRWLGLGRITPPATRLECFTASPHANTYLGTEGLARPVIPSNASSMDGPGEAAGIRPHAEAPVLTPAVPQCVRGAWAAFAPATRTLAVLDQAAQRMAFVDLNQLDGRQCDDGVGGFVNDGGGAVKGGGGGGANRSAPGAAAAMVQHVAVPVADAGAACSAAIAAAGNVAAEDQAAATAFGQAAGGEAAQQEQPAGQPSAEESCKLQVVAACGEGRVATGHPDGRVLIWDTARRCVDYTLPSLEGCGRGAVLALAADGPLLAAAYGAEVLVWELPAARGSARLAPALAALIKPTLATAVRSMALSAKHGVLALRSCDGVELRAARGGRWLHGFTDRANTSLLAAGDVLFVASSSPSFLGNNFLEFQIEVATVDLAALLYRSGDGGGGGTAGGDGAADAGAGAGVGGGGAAQARDGGGGGAHQEQALSRRAHPVVVRTLSPLLRYDLRGCGPLSEFKWDQPMQAALTGGRLLLRCLQFPLRPGQLAWPGLFSFRVVDLVHGLALGRSAAFNGVDTGVNAAPPAVPLPPPAAPLDAAAAVAAAEPQHPHQGEGAAREGQDGGQPAAAVDPGAPAPPPPADPSASGAPAAAAEVVVRTLAPEVLCADWSRQGVADGGGACGGSAAAASSAGGQAEEAAAASGGNSMCGCGGAPGSVVPSVQLLVTPRHMVLVCPCQRVWLLDIPYTGPRRAL